MNIFLLRGLVREKEHWGEFVLKVKASFPQAQIFTPEIPGVGEFCHQTSPSSFKLMVEFMRNRHLDKFQPGNTNIIMALSLGGMIAREWMELYPHDFKQAILVNTSFRGISPIYRRLRPLAIIEFIKIFFTKEAEARETKILQLVSNQESNNPVIINKWIEIQKKRPVGRKSFLNQILAAIKYHPPLTKPQAKLLILAGTGDRLCHYTCSVELFRVWGGEIYLHQIAGHEIPSDAPEWMIDKMKNFIDQ